MNSVKNNRYAIFADIFLEISNLLPSQDSKMLVIGPGQGLEVLALKNYFKDIIAIEPDYKNVSAEARPYVKKGSVTALEFPDESFDVVYCYHVLEHIREYKKAILEMSRVLKKGGLLYLGVPNKLRVVSYIFSSEVPLKNRVKWLLADYRMKLIGKFENCFGAHAGFTKEELKKILVPVFSTIENKTDAYYVFKYENNIGVKIIRRSQFLKKFLWPSLYFICKK